MDSFSAAIGHASPPSWDAMALTSSEAPTGLEDFNSQDVSHTMHFEILYDDDNPGTLLGDGPPASVVEGLISFNEAISACDQGGHWQRLSPLLVEMRRGGLPLK
eukprot:9245172-Karenia_brevis.AAC.1